MAFNGVGTYNLYTPGNPVVTGTTISSTWANNTLTDIASGLSNTICKDGQTTVTANIPFGNFKVTSVNLGDSTAKLIPTGGSTSRSLADITGETLSVKDFGAVGDGSTDDSTAIQSAVTYAVSIGAALYFPTGNYKIGTTINVTAKLKVYGAGMYSTTITLGTATLVGFTVTSLYAFEISDLNFACSTTSTGGYAISITGTGGAENYNSRIENVVFTSLYDSVYINAGHNWQIKGCSFFGVIDAGIIINNSVNADGGDNVIAQNAFSGVASPASTADSIRHTSGGGLIVLANKFFKNGTAYHMNWNSTTSSSQVSLQGNHVEAQVTGGFVFEDSQVSGGVGGINIAANYMLMATAIPCIWFKTNRLTAFGPVTSSGNTLIAGASGTCYQIDGGAAYSISGDTWQGYPSGATGLATANSTAQSIQVGANQYYGLNTIFNVNTASQLVGTQYIPTSAASPFQLHSFSGGFTTLNSSTFTTIATGLAANGAVVAVRNATAGGVDLLIIDQFGGTPIQSVFTGSAGPFTYQLSGSNLQAKANSGTPNALIIFSAGT